MSPFLEIQTSSDQESGISDELLAEIRKNNAEVIAALKEKLWPDSSSVSAEENDPYDEADDPEDGDRLYKIISSLPEKLDLLSMDQELHSILFELSLPSDAPPIPEILQRLPDRIEYSKVSEKGYQFLSYFIRKGYASSIIHKLPVPDTLDFSKTGKQEVTFFSEVLQQQRDFAVGLAACFPSVLDISSMTEAAGDLFFLIMNLNDDYTLDFFEKIPSRLSTSDIGVVAKALEIVIWNDAFLKIILEKLPDQIDISTLNGSARFFFQRLLLEAPEQTIAKLPTVLDLSNVGLYGRLFIKDILDLKKSKYIHEILSRLPPVIRFSQLSNHGGALLFQLLERYMLPENHIIDIKSRIVVDSADFSVTSVSTGFSSQLLLMMLKHYQELQDPRKDAVLNMINRKREALRIPIPSVELQAPVEDSAGPSLAEIVRQFPVDPSSVEKLKHDWVRAELMKTGSKAFVYIRMNEEDVRILFRNEDIHLVSLEGYKKALQTIPEFVSTPVYPELMDEEFDAKAKIRLSRPGKGGFREVFSGPDLGTIKEKNLPPSLKKNIDEQVCYIAFMLSLIGVDHGHAHTHNLNARFLLEDKAGNKFLSFDVNNALQMARKYNLTLTPIVILRDWDQASS